MNGKCTHLMTTIQQALEDNWRHSSAFWGGNVWPQSFNALAVITIVDLRGIQGLGTTPFEQLMAPQHSHWIVDFYYRKNLERSIRGLCSAGYKTCSMSHHLKLMEEDSLGRALWLNLEACIEKAILELQMAWVGLVPLMHASLVMCLVTVWHFQLLIWMTVAKNWKILRVPLLSIY